MDEMLSKEIDFESLTGINPMELKNSSKEDRLPVPWISAQDCTGCLESFIHSTFISINNLLLDYISIEYSELLSIASGDQLEEHKDKLIEENKGKYILIIEGSIPQCDDFLLVGGRSIREDIIYAAGHAKAILAFGSCASWGGIAAASPNPTGSVPITDIIKDVPIALIPGCPPIAEVMVGTLLYIHIHGHLPELDKKGRPKRFYQYTVHQQCHRKPFFDQKLYAESYADEGAHKDYCLFKLGCKGPSTFNSCESIGWNGGLGSPITAGSACIGCSEKGFWDKGTLCCRKPRE